MPLVINCLYCTVVHARQHTCFTVTLTVIVARTVRSYQLLLAVECIDNKFANIVQSNTILALVAVM